MDLSKKQNKKTKFYFIGFYPILFSFWKHFSNKAEIKHTKVFDLLNITRVPYNFLIRDKYYVI
jgi:hypothetical protein